MESGHLIRATMHVKKPISMNCYTLDEGVFRSAAERANMADVEIERPEATAVLEGDEDEAYWKRFLEQPMFSVMKTVNVSELLT